MLSFSEECLRRRLLTFLLLGGEGEKVCHNLISDCKRLTASWLLLHCLSHAAGPAPMTFSEIKSALADLSPEQLRELHLLTGYLSKPEQETPVLSSLGLLLLSVLEEQFGKTVPRHERILCVNKLLDVLCEVGVFTGVATPAQRLYQARCALMALFRGIEEDGHVVSWRSIMIYSARLGDVLERQFPHYRVTGVFTLAAQRQVKLAS
jgi:hypothetical protein